MTSNYLSVLVGAVAAVAAAASAHAADLNGGSATYGGSIKDSYVAPAPARSWYLRVDGGYGWHGTPEIFNAQNTLLDDASIGGNGIVGAGIGMYFGPRWRADLTYDHAFAAKVKGTAGDNIVGVGNPHIFAEGKMTRDLFLANMYYDFDFGGRVTPYIGGGIGFAHHQFSDGILSASFGSGTIDDKSSTSFAAALMAGVSFAIAGGQSNCCASVKDAPVASNRGLMLDVGYRFVYEGGAHTGDTHIAGITGDPLVDDIISHEVRVGLRYNMN